MAYNYDTNPYYNPEALGLEIVGTVDDPFASWSFDMFVIWKDAEGNFYWKQDSGCSCPSPFEACDLEDLNKIENTDSGWAKFTVAVEEYVADIYEFRDYRYDDGEQDPRYVNERAAFRATVMEIVMDVQRGMR